MFGLFTKQPESNTIDVALRFFDTARSSKVPFTPLSKKEVTMYSCGPTVYDHIHIGNLRSFLVPDIAKRVLLYQGYTVKHTINFTDFGHLTDDGDAGEDKMMKGMQRDGYPITLDGMRDFAEPYIESFKRDMERFGNLSPTTYARASDFVKEQIKLIETLDEKGYTYETSDGVYFDVSTFPEYGELGNINLEQLKAGARVEVNSEKKHPADFALWKKADLGWQSKYGTGFPGWHIECTAMAFSTLGKQIDIHTGGEDLAYTHHNGEIAQAESITGKSYVQYWLHNAHITIDNEKIAKSANNGLTLQELIDAGYHPSDYRLWLLQSHYRTTANFSYSALDASKQALTRLKRHVYETLGEQAVVLPNQKYEEQFLTALGDDLDTPKAVAILFEVSKDESLTPAEQLATIQAFDSILELGLSLPVAEGAAALGYVSNADLPDDITERIEQRDLARAARNWDESDRLRDELKQAGYTVEDTKDGTRVSRT